MPELHLRDSASNLPGGLRDWLLRVADADYQRRIWLGGEDPDICDSLTETLCEFDDLYDPFTHAAIYELAGASAEELELIGRFAQLLSAFARHCEDSNLSDVEAIRSPAWHKCRSEAQLLLQRLEHGLFSR